MQFRPAIDPDVPEILDMMEDFNRHEGIPWRRGPGEGPLRTLISSPTVGIMKVGVAEGRALAYFILTWGWDLEWGGPDAFLTELYLRPEARGGGLGRQTLEVALATAREHDARAVHLMVRLENLPAFSLYQSSGFELVPRALMTCKL